MTQNPIPTWLPSEKWKSAFTQKSVYKCLSFMIARTWNKPKSLHWWMDCKLWDICKMEYSLAIKRNTFLTEVITCMNFICTALKVRFKKLPTWWIHLFTLLQRQQGTERSLIARGWAGGGVDYKGCRGMWGEVWNCIHILTAGWWLCKCMYGLKFTELSTEKNEFHCM